MQHRLLALVLSPLFATLVGCAASDEPHDFSPPPSASGDAGVDADPFNSGDSGPVSANVVGHLTGTVLAPNGTMPVAGALVYLTGQKPSPEPEHVFCDGCVTLPNGAPHAIADAKGAFDVGATQTGSQYIVIQKGGFRKVREIYVSKGDEKLPTSLTTLPPRTDLVGGDEVPRMTVVKGGYDEIEASLAKLGIDPSALDMVESPLIGQAAKAFLTDAKKVNGRHIIFLPCGDYTQPSPNVDLSTDPTIQANLRAFVEAGGRVYATDWHYDFIARTFPGFVNFQGASNTACSGCGKIPYTANAKVEDPSLAAWMQGQGLGQFDLQKNYTGIASVQPTSVTTSSGTKMVTPKVWVSGSVNGGPVKPATVSFEYGCGRVLFSTYHTEPFSLQLTPQERALLGVLLEVSVCNDSSSGVIVK